MTFGQPLFLTALLLVPLAFLLILWGARRRQAAFKRLGDPALVQRLSASVNWRGRRWRDGLWLLALTLLIVALARPQWGTQTQPVERQGVQLMVALDVSNSMLAQDIRPSRLVRAKTAISELMDRLDGDEIGLVLFSGASYIHFPLTSDYTTAKSFLDTADTRSIARQGTALADAIRTAMTGFDQSRTSQKAIIIVTDGETHDADALAAAQQAAQQGVVIYTIGLGSAEGANIPEYNQFGQLVGYKTDNTGQTVISRLNEDILRQIASITGGQYWLGGSGSELDALAAELDRLQTGEVESRTAFIYVERYQWFLLVAFLAMAAAELIPDRKGERLGLPTLRLPHLRRRQLRFGALRGER